MAVCRRLWTSGIPAQSRASAWHAIPWRVLRSVALRTLCCAIALAAVTRARAKPHVDLYPSYVAAHLANEGEWGHIYHEIIWLDDGSDPEWDRRATELVHAPLAGTSFVYHPWYLSALRPLVAHVDYPTFQSLWLWINRTCVVLASLALALLLGWETLIGQVFLTLLVGCASVTQSSIYLGQNGLPALTLAVAAALSWQSGAPLLLGGVLAGLAWVCKPWCATLLGLCFLLRGIRAGVLTSAGLAAIMLVLPELGLPGVLMRDYHAMNASLTKVFVWGQNNHSILSIIERATSPDWSKHLHDWHPMTPSALHRGAAFGVSVFILATGGIVWWRRRPGSDWTIVAWLAFMIVPLGITWDHYFIFALPLAVLATFSPRSPRGLRALGFALTLLLAASFPLYDVSKAQVDFYRQHPAGAPWLRTIPMLLLSVSLLAALRFGRRREAPSTATGARELPRAQLTSAEAPR